jgi:hypothetical protein
MKKHLEQDELLAEVLAEGASAEFREATLAHGCSLARRRRRNQRFILVSTCLAVPIVLAVTMLLWQTRQTKPAVMAIQKAAPKIIEGTSIRILTDEELLEFFKGRPTALVGLPGKQQLVLLDEVMN